MTTQADLKDMTFVHQMPEGQVTLSYDELHARLQGLTVMPVIPTTTRDGGHKMSYECRRKYTALAVDNTFVAGGHIVSYTDTFRLVV